MAGVDSQWPNEHTESFHCHIAKKLNPKPFKERSQENKMLQKTNTKITAPSVKSVWCIVLQSFIWRHHVGVLLMASNQQKIWTSVCDKSPLFLLVN